MFLKIFYSAFYRKFYICFHSPVFLITIFFHLIINAPLFSGLVTYGDDTGGADIPYRIYASAMFASNNLPLWYPNAGNGVPQISIEFVGLTFNPLGLLIAYLRPYDLISFAFENSLWRLVGHIGVYLFAKTWGIHSIGATAIAATYVGSGTMSRASLAFATLIGQMTAPWLLAGASLAILSQSKARLLAAAGIIGLTAGIMSWSGGLVVLLMAPALSGPVLIALAMSQKGALGRLLTAVAISVPILFLLTLPIISETLNGPTKHFSPTYRSQESDMLVGHVKSIDFLGLLLVNPSYILENGSDDLKPLYSGIIPIILILLTILPSSFRSPKTHLFIFSTTIFIIVNSQNWHFLEHPILPFNLSLIYNYPFFNSASPAVFLILPLIFIAKTWSIPSYLPRFDKILLMGVIWIFLVTTNNYFANYLRSHLPPFSLVRHNMLYFWMVTLYVSVVGWRRFEALILHLDETTIKAPILQARITTFRGWLSSLRNNLADRPMTKASLQSLFISIGLLITAFLSADGNREGTSRPAYELVGVFHLAWQAYLSIFIFLFFIFSINLSTSIKFSRILFLFSIFTFTCMLLLGHTFRKYQFVIPRTPVADIARLLIDSFHLLIIASLFVVGLIVCRSKMMARMLISSVMIFDVMLAVPRYVSDNERFATPQLGWPFTLGELASGRASALSAPDQGDGSLKSDFWLPFRGAMRSYPDVRAVRAEWGDAYGRWMHFPRYWYEDISSLSAYVPYDALQMPAFSPLRSRTAVWGVTGEDIGGRSETPGLSRLSSQTIPSLTILYQFREACKDDSSSSFHSSVGRIITLLPTLVKTQVFSDCQRLMVFTDSWSKGWSLRLDGIRLPVFKVNNALRGALVPSGAHELIWEYSPPNSDILIISVVFGVFISFFCVFCPYLDFLYLKI